MGNCSKKEVCSNCGGSGRMDIYTESSLEHTVAVFLDDGRDYERPTKRVTCDVCHGRGKVQAYHDYVFSHNITKKIGGFFSPTYPVAVYRCANCGDRKEWGVDA